jgi:PadR family transcriptional regulator, regulatory protein PadR
MANKMTKKMKKMMSVGCGKEEGASPHEGRMSRFLQPFLLLLLSEKASYGYDLIRRLRVSGVHDIHLDPGAVYKNLRIMQENGWIASEWKIKSAGAPTRIYKINREGEKILHQWFKVIKKRHEMMSKLMNRYDRLFGNKGK